MGIVIFTKDDSKFMVGDYIIMVKEIDTSLSNPEVNYILRTNKFTEADVIAWLPYITTKLIVCIDKAPKITKKTEDNVIIDKSLNVLNDRSSLTAITAIINWSDRLRVWKQIQTLPVPYALVFLKQNVTNIDTWRLIAKTNMELPEDYTRAVFAYSITGKRQNVAWPKKRKVKEQAPLPFRMNDKYWQKIITSKEIANEIRDKGVPLPKGMKKTKQKVNEWV
tara:strand:+ start:782 stop:1447 length:666 start_codon:yes stop_codon:yes gene_type:complete